MGMRSPVLREISPDFIKNLAIVSNNNGGRLSLDPQTAMSQYAQYGGIANILRMRKLLLINLLHCIECKQIIVPPLIRICKALHFVCKECSFNLPWCQKCNVVIKELTFADETLGCIGVETICRNPGCKEALLYCTIPFHARLCRYQGFSCPLSTPYEYCPWKGGVTGIKQHLFSKHWRVITVSREADIPIIRVDFKLLACRMVVLRKRFNEVFAVKIYFTEESGQIFLNFDTKYAGPVYFNPVYKFELYLGVSAKYLPARKFEHVSNQNLEDEIGKGLSVKIPINELKYFCNIEDLDDVHDVRFTLYIQRVNGGYLIHD